MQVVGAVKIDAHLIPDKAVTTTIGCDVISNPDLSAIMGRNAEYKTMVRTTEKLERESLA